MEKIRKELSNFEKLSEHSKCGLDECKRVRSLVLVWLIKIVIANFGIKITIGETVSASIYFDTVNNKAS